MLGAENRARVIVRVTDHLGLGHTAAEGSHGLDLAGAGVHRQVSDAGPSDGAGSRTDQRRRECGGAGDARSTWFVACTSSISLRPASHRGQPKTPYPPPV